jgi:hypothetical protein
MDPLSIALSVITLLELTKKVIIFAKQNKDAPTDRARVIQEASSLAGLLSTLKDFIKDCDDSEDPWLQATSSLTAAGGPLHQYRLTLEMVVDKIVDRHRKIGQAIAWMLSKEEIARLLSQIERVKSFIQIALEIDHTFVSLLSVRLSGDRQTGSDLGSDGSSVSRFICPLRAWMRYMLTGIGNSRAQSAPICKTFETISPTSRSLLVLPWTTLP